MLKSLFKKESDAIFCVKLMILALLLRFCLAGAYYNFFILYLKKPLYAFDGEAYSIVGWYIALILKGVNVFMLPGFLMPNDYAVVGGFFGTIAGFDAHLPPIHQYGVGIYSYMIGFFYYIFGYAPVLLRSFNSIFSVLSAFLVYDIAKRSFGKNVARISFAIMLFNPSFILYSISLQRDTLINFLILLVVSEALKIDNTETKARTFGSIALVLSGLVLLYNLRINSMAVLTVFLVILAYIRFAHVYKRLAAYVVIGVLLVPPLYSKIFGTLYSKLILMLKYHWGLTFLGGYTFQLLPSRYYGYGDTGEGLFSQGISALDLFIASIRGVAAFLSEPSFFSMYKISHLIALPQMIIWYFIVIFACIGAYNSIKSSTVLKMSLLVVMLLFTLSIGLSEANAETLIRHRDMIVPIYIIFAAKGIEVVGSSRRVVT